MSSTTSNSSNSEPNSGDESGSSSSSSSESLSSNGDSTSSSSSNNIDNGDNDDDNNNSDSSSSTMSSEEDDNVIAEQIQGAIANESETRLFIYLGQRNFVAFTPSNAQRIMDCLRENPRFKSLFIVRCFGLDNPAVLHVFHEGLLDCPSITNVSFRRSNLTSDGLDLLRPALYNTSITSLDISISSHIRGQHGGEAIHTLVVGNNSLMDLDLSSISFDRPFVIALGSCLHQLQKLTLKYCGIGNVADGVLLTNLLLPVDGMNNTALTNLNISSNHIEGAEGGRQVGLLLQHCPNLKFLDLMHNALGPLGARAIGPGLVAVSHLEHLNLAFCRLEDGAMYLDNTSLTSLDLRLNHIQGENLIALALRCTNLDNLNVHSNILNPDQQRRLDLVLDRKRMCREANALAGSTFPVLFGFVKERAHHHEHGLSAIFVILQNDGDDYFCNANNRAIP